MADSELAGASATDENPAERPPAAEDLAGSSAAEEPGGGVGDAAVADDGVPPNPPPGAAAEVGKVGNAEVKGGPGEGEGEGEGDGEEKAIGELKHEDGGKEGLGEEVASQSFDFNAQGGGEGYESGSEEEQAAFMRELAAFFRERTMEFKPPKFYGEGLNCLKLWRAVIRLGGYDQVTYCKLWRQVGESFRPPKTCTTVSWTFRGFYEKALLDYERHKVQIGEVIVAASPLSEPPGAKNQISGSKTPNSGRARRDAAARAMQGWHSQRLLGNGEVGDPIIKDKSTAALAKREKQLKNLSPVKRRKSSSMDRGVKVARIKVAHPRDGQIGSPGSRSETTVIDIGPAADWVKINVQRTRDCFEVYALVPGLLREEVRVQSDPAGRLVISGEPEQPDNPWGVTPFKKIVSLPSRIDPNQTSAVVTLHGQLFVRVPFEQSA